MFSLPTEMRKPALPYRPEDFLSGVIALPPWIRGKRSRFYAYPFEITVNTPLNQQNQIQLEGDSFFLLEGINVIAENLTGDVTSTLKMSLSDTSRGINWSTNALALPNISGRGDCTKYLSSPMIFKPGSTILYAVNNNPSTTPIYGVLFGRKIFDLTTSEADFLLRRAWYQYDILTGPIAAGATNSFPLNTAVDSDFYLWRMECSEGIFFNDTAAPLLVAVRDITTNKNMFDQKANIKAVTGQQYQLSTSIVQGTFTGRPFCYTIPRRISRNSALLLDITNTASSPTDIFGPANFTLEGVRVF